MLRGPGWGQAKTKETKEIIENKSRKSTKQIISEQAAPVEAVEENIKPT